MRTYYRVVPTDEHPNGSQWIEVDTDANGYNDMVYFVTLCQVLLLNLNESPFYSTYGLPAQQSVLQQTFPDYNVALTQQIFAPFFANLLIKRIGTNSSGDPVYSVSVTTHQGAIINAQIFPQPNNQPVVP